MKTYDRLSILVSLVLLGLALTLIIGLPQRTIYGDVLGSPVAIVLNGRLIMTLLLCSLTAVGTEYIMRAHPGFGGERVDDYSFMFWILPSLVTLAGAWFTPLLVDNLLVWLVGLGVTASLLAVVIVAEYRTVDQEDPLYTPARLFLNVVTYVAALALFSAVYGAKLRSVLSASSVALLAVILALTLLRASRGTTARTWVYAAIAGILMGEATWALNYWGVSGLIGGGMLMLIFYFFTGLSQQQLLDRFSRPVLVEFGVVGIMGLSLLASQGAFTW